LDVSMAMRVIWFMDGSLFTLTANLGT
jgi:hypothetical protein